MRQHVVMVLAIASAACTTEEPIVESSVQHGAVTVSVRYDPGSNETEVAIGEGGKRFAASYEVRGGPPPTAADVTSSATDLLSSLAERPTHSSADGACGPNSIGSALPESVTGPLERGCQLHDDCLDGVLGCEHSVADCAEMRDDAWEGVCNSFSNWNPVGWACDSLVAGMEVASDFFTSRYEDRIDEVRQKNCGGYPLND